MAQHPNDGAKYRFLTWYSPLSPSHLCPAYLVSQSHKVASRNANTGVRTVGIDPLGGTDPNSPNIKWGSVASSDARWEWKDDPVGTPTRVTVVAVSDKMTFFVKTWFDRGDLATVAWLPADLPIVAALIAAG